MLFPLHRPAGTVAVEFIKRDSREIQEGLLTNAKVLVVKRNMFSKLIQRLVRNMKDHLTILVLDCGIS